MTMTIEDYKKWEGEGEAFTGDVYTIDENGVSVKKLDMSEWGSLTQYIPYDEVGLMATRTVKTDADGPYLEITLGKGWNKPLRVMVGGLKFRFSDNPNYTGHASLKNFKILKMDSGDAKLKFDKIEWELIPGYPVDQYQTIKPDGDTTYTQKFYFRKVDDPEFKICAYWCWR